MSRRRGHGDGDGGQSPVTAVPGTREAIEREMKKRLGVGADTIDTLDEDARAAVRLMEQHIASVERNLRLDPRVPDLASVLRTN